MFYISILTEESVNYEILYDSVYSGHSSRPCVPVKQKNGANKRAPFFSPIYTVCGIDSFISSLAPTLSLEGITEIISSSSSWLSMMER